MTVGVFFSLQVSRPDPSRPSPPPHASSLPAFHTDVRRARCDVTSTQRISYVRYLSDERKERKRERERETRNGRRLLVFFSRMTYRHTGEDSLIKRTRRRWAVSRRASSFFSYKSDVWRTYYRKYDVLRATNVWCWNYVCVSFAIYLVPNVTFYGVAWLL